MSGDEVILAAVYEDERRAQQAIDRLNDKGVALDMLSVLGPEHASGDDLLGINYADEEGRKTAWLRLGGLWGALWGSFTGAAAGFVWPISGLSFTTAALMKALLAAPVGGLAGGVLGRLLGRAIMTGAAAVARRNTAIRRKAIPQGQLDRLRQAIETGHFVLLLREGRDRTQPWLDILRRSAAIEVLELPCITIV